MLDSGHGHFKFRRDTIDISMPKRESLIRCLPYSPDKLDGLKASMGIYDEFAQADSADQKNVIASSMGTRAEPLIVDITTASAKTETPFVEELEAYKRILRGEAEGDNIFAHIFEPDPWDDPFKVETWYKVHPHLGITVNEDSYIRQA
jgi:phage terminase large subunit-like protein